MTTQLTFWKDFIMSKNEKNFLHICSFFVYLVLVLSLFSCNHKKDYIYQQEILEKKGKFGSNTVGINSKKEIIIENSERADLNIEKLLWDQQELEAEVRYIKEQIKLCIHELSDPRLGKQKTELVIPEVTDEDYRWDRESLILKNNGDLDIVKQSLFKERYKDIQARNKKLTYYKKRLAKIQEKCQLKLRDLRIERGLLAKKEGAKGYFKEDGTWIQTEEAENNLDDSFSRKATKKKSNKKS